jgi:hypothetical protein
MDWSWFPQWGSIYDNAERLSFIPELPLLFYRRLSSFIYDNVERLVFIPTLPLLL